MASYRNVLMAKVEQKQKQDLDHAKQLLVNMMEIKKTLNRDNVKDVLGLAHTLYNQALSVLPDWKEISLEENGVLCDMIYILNDISGQNY